jgi:hypothetical protein
MNKMSILGAGWIAYCKDTENNIFGIIEMNVDSCNYLCNLGLTNTQHVINYSTKTISTDCTVSNMMYYYLFGYGHIVKVAYCSC